jgi:hypothetical protein
LRRPTNDNKTANIFAKYFAGVCTTDPHGYRVNSQPEVMQISSVIENVQFTEEENKNCICSLKSTSSPGADGITTLLLKNCVDYTGLHLKKSWLMIYLF